MTHRLSWNRPLPEQAVALLTRDWANGPLDLRGWLVLVQTRQAGRRLREALAVWAAARGTAVLPPTCATPEAVFGQAESGDRPVAHPLETACAWSATLLALDLEALRALFPSDPPERSVGWALNLGTTLQEVRQTLAEGGLRLGDVAARLPADHPERARWEALGAVESAYLAEVERRGRIDPEERKLAGATAPARPRGWTRALLLANPDPPLPVCRILSAWRESGLAVEIATYGPTGEEGWFDEWGRPTDRWLEDPPPWPDFRDRVHLCADPRHQAQRLLELARAAGPERVALGSADPEVSDAAGASAAAAGVAWFNPEGRSGRTHPLAHLGRALGQVLRRPAWAAVRRLLSHPWVLEALARGTPPAGGFRRARLLAGLDAWQERHLPVGLDEALALLETAPPEAPEVAPALRAVRRWLDALTPEAGPAALAGWMREIVGPRLLRLDEPAGARTAAVLTAWMEDLRVAIGLSAAYPSWQTADWLDLLLDRLSRARAFEDKPAHAHEVQGWLELVWEDQPHLAVAGLNEGLLPETVLDDPFLPETLREALGLKTNRARLARDTWQLAALRQARAEGGRLDLLLGKATRRGDPLKPSRLLLPPGAGDLPERVRWLFRELPPDRPTPPWRPAWRLTLARPALPSAWRVTGFRDFLEHPLLFHFRQALRLSEVDPAPVELDAPGFGSLCHAALQALGRPEAAALRVCADPVQLREFLRESLARVCAERFGPHPGLAVRVQIESARQRLDRAAEVEAASQEEGWELVATEWRLPAHPALRWCDRPLRGQIDRLDRHRRTGQWRVLDYKTGDRASQPAQAHLASPRTTPDPAWMLVEAGGKPRRWSDLQLPLYVWAARHGVPGREAGAPILAGYFNLPRAVSETSLLPWSDLSDALVESAVACAAAITAEVTAGRWDYSAPSAALEEPPWNRLLFRDPAQTLEAVAAPDPAEQDGPVPGDDPATQPFSSR